MLGEGDTFGITGSFVAPEKWFSINFSKAKDKFCLSLHYNADNSYLLVNGKEILKFKLTIKMFTFQHNFDYPQKKLPSKIPVLLVFRHLTLEKEIKIKTVN